VECIWHLCSLPAVLEDKFCGKKCKNKHYVQANRRKNKERLVQLHGGKCIRCGYSKSLAALVFHHTDNNKEFGIGAKGHTRSFDKLVAEAAKCELLCANCHAETHAIHLS
jgi:hypothetical protein